MKTQSTLQILLLTICLSIVCGTTKAYAQPSNDLIEDAIDLNQEPSPYSESNVLFNHATTTNDATPGGTGCALTQAGVWYTFTPTKSGNVAAGILNPDGAVVIFFTGPPNATDGNQLTHVDQNSNACDFSPLANIDVAEGTTYYLYMRNLAISDVNINATNAFAVPSNDLIENATDVNGTEYYAELDIHMLLVTNTNDGGQNGNCNTGSNPAIWYKFTAQGSGLVVAETSASPDETAIIFYSSANENATNGTDLTYVDEPLNTCGPNNKAFINAVEGTTYYLYVSNLEDKYYLNVTIDFENILGVEQDLLEGFSFYPNPVTETLNINAKTNIDEVRIFDVLGQQVFLQNLETTQGQLQLSSLKSGIYILQVSSEGKTGSYKLVKK